MAKDDVYKLIQRFAILGVEAAITRWYQQTTIPGGADRIVFAWLADKLPAILAGISNQVTATSVEVQNLNDPVDFAKTTGSLGVGGSPEDPMPQYNAYGLQFPSVDRRVRASTLRIPGVTDGALVSGSVPAAVQTYFDGVADELVIPLDAVDSFYDPVIYTPGNTRTGGVPLIVPITSGFFARLTTQNSRKA